MGWQDVHRQNTFLQMDTQLRWTLGLHDNMATVAVACFTWQVCPLPGNYAHLTGMATHSNTFMWCPSVVLMRAAMYIEICTCVNYVCNYITDPTGVCAIGVTCTPTAWHFAMNARPDLRYQAMLPSELTLAPRE